MSHRKLSTFPYSASIAGRHWASPCCPLRAMSGAAWCTSRYLRLAVFHPVMWDHLLSERGSCGVLICFVCRVCRSCDRTAQFTRVDCDGRRRHCCLLVVGWLPAAAGGGPSPVG